jgi:hypothetical protein
LLSVEEFQEYLEVLAEKRYPTPARRYQLMVSYAELQFRLHGGSRCSICHAHVRHVLPVSTEHQDGSRNEFSCLCLRCLQAEKAISRKVILRAGKTAVEYGSS